MKAKNKLLLLVSLLNLSLIICNKETFNHNYICGVDLNYKNIHQKEINNYSKRNLGDDEDDDVEQINCFDEENFGNDDYFGDLKIYLDTYNLLDEIGTNNLNSHKNIILKVINNAAKRLEDILKMYLPPIDLVIENEILNKLGIQSWNETLIKSSIIYETNGQYSNNIHYIIMFKFGNGETMGKTISSAEPIIFEPECKQPMIGIVTLNPNIDYSNLPESYLEIVMFHEFTHLIAFHKTILQNYDLINTITDSEGTVHHYIKSNNVKQFALQYFGCDVSDFGVEIESINGNPGSHWSSRILLGEYMADISYSEELALSGFTLSLFKDLPYLKVKNEYTGGLMRFGKHKGCNFLKEKCIGNTNFENEFYYPTNFDLTFSEPSCSSGRQSKTVHKIYQYNDGSSSTIPSVYQYFTEHNTIGGLPSTNYCPISQYASETIYIGHCSEKGTSSNLADLIGEKHSQNSFCALSTLVKKSIQNYQSYTNTIRSVCFQMYCSDKSLTIKVGDDFIVCPREGGKVASDNYDGYLLCPDYNLICTTNDNDKLCNDMLECLSNQVGKKDNTFNYNDFGSIQTTQNSRIYISQEINSIDNWEKDESTGKCPLYCTQCKNNRRCFKCKNDYGLLGSNENNGNEEIICKELTILESNPYYQNSKSVFYPCIEYCVECANGNTCITCITNYKVDENGKCVEKVKNCQVYDGNSCQTCKEGFGLLKEGEETFCEEIGKLQTNYYFYETDHYIKCSYAISNCNKCESSINCIECENNFAIINDNHQRCEDLSTNKYYLDSEDGKYKLCSSKLTGCETCIKISNTILNCNKCEATYGLVHDEANYCSLLTTLQNDYSLFTDDNKLNYYSCRDNKYHLVNNCLTCQTKDTCNSCQNGYVLFNSNKLCLSEKEIQEKKYYKNSTDNNYYLCSHGIKGCEKCNNAEECIECNIAFDLDEYNKCISSSLTTNKYYLNFSNGKYESCTKIENCDECTSATECTRCQNGYELNNNICQIIENESNDKTKAIAIAGIALSCVAIVVSIVTIIIIIFRRLLFRGNVEKINSSTVEVQNPNNEEANEIIVQPSKRSIHNVQKENNE